MTPDADVVAELEGPGPAPWRSPIPFLWLAIAMLVTAALAALASGAADAPEDGDASARIVAAAGSTTAVDFAFSSSLTFDDAGNELIAGSSTTMEGRFDAETGRMEMHTTGDSGFSMDTIVDDRIQYTRFPAGSLFSGATEGKPWGRRELPERRASGGLSGASENPLARLVELGRLRSPVVRVGEEQVRGVDTVRYRTTVADIGDAVSPLEVWLDGDDRLRRYRSTSEVEETRFTMTFEVFDIGTPVTIDLPPEDQVGTFDPAAVFGPRPPTTDGD